MKSTEFIFEKTEPVTGMTLYHGTLEKNVIGIMKHGLVPRYNRWETKYGGDPKNSVKGVFVTPNLDDAIRFCTNNSYSNSGGVVLSFTLLPSDIVEGERFFDNELIIKNTISPDRLCIAWPKGKEKLLDKKKEQAQISINKTAIIKAINKLTRPLGVYCKSASKTTSRVITYYQADQYYDESLLLPDYPAYLTKRRIDPAIVQQVSRIIAQ